MVNETLDDRLAPLDDATVAPQPHPERNGAGDDGARAMFGPGAAEQATRRQKVIKFSHVSKRFVLHQHRVHSFQEMLTGLIGRGRRLAKPPPDLAPPARDFWALRDVNFSVY